MHSIPDKIFKIKKCVLEIEIQNISEQKVPEAIFIYTLFLCKVIFVISERHFCHSQ